MWQNEPPRDIEGVRVIGLDIMAQHPVIQYDMLEMV
jgi:hypothetical protein